jgi:hypothetical protein
VARGKTIGEHVRQNNPKRCTAGGLAMERQKRDGGELMARDQKAMTKYAVRVRTGYTGWMLRIL